MNVHSSFCRRIPHAAVLTLGLASLLLSRPVPGSAETPPVRLRGHIPPLTATARVVARVAAGEPMRLALTLPLRNQAQLNDLLMRLYDPHDPAYGQFLTPEQFTARFGPTQADYDAIAAFA